jgi:glycosyltransferase involved in cell wall biosynthesis
LGLPLVHDSRVLEARAGAPITSTPLRRVAILGPAPPDRGGIARETALLVAHLERRVEVRWLTYSRRYPRWLDPRRFDLDARLKSVPEALPMLDYRSPRSWARTASAVAEAGCDALLVPWWTAFWGLPMRAVMRRLARRSPATRRVLICHNVIDHEGGALRRFLSMGAFLAADAFVVHSASDARALARAAPGRPSVVLPHPVAPPAAAPSREEARRALGLNEKPLLLFLGLVRSYKGVDVLLDAAPEIVRRSDARIAVVGEVFPEARELSRRAASSPVRDRILWKDAYVPEEEMDAWLAACDVVVLPYREISGSGIAARAIAAARPIAAAAVGGLTDVVEPGETGELFPPGDASGLAAAVERVLSGGAPRYAPGLERAARRMSWENYVQAVLEFVGRSDR